MEAITYDLQGLKELEKELLQLPDKLARRSLARAASEGARLVRDKARENARSMGLADSGTLVKSINVKRKKIKNWRTTQIYGVYHSSKPYKKKAEKSGGGSTAPYGKFYERGYTDKAGNWVHRPHIRPALDTNAELVAQTVKDRLTLEIRTIQHSGIARPK